MNKQRHITNIVQEGDGKLLVRIDGIIPIYPGQMITIKRVGHHKVKSSDLEFIVQGASLSTDAVVVIQRVIVDCTP